MMRSLLIFILLTGCAVSADKTSSNANWKLMSFEQRQSTLSAIADQCKLARSAMGLRNGDELLFRPDSNSSYDSVDCALGKLKGVFGLEKMGFVGNEAYTEEKQ